MFGLIYGRLQVGVQNVSRVMSLTKIQTILILGGAFAAGVLAGWMAQPHAYVSAAGASLGGQSSPAAGAQAANGARGVDPGAETDAGFVLPNRSEQERFGGFDLEKQADVLRRLAQKEAKDLRTSALALLAKIVPQLSADQTAALLGDLSGGRLENLEIRRFLAERLAELDAQRALDLGKKLGDTKMLGATLVVMGEEDAAKALAVVKTLPLDQGKEALTYYLQQVGGGQGKGNALEVAAVLKETPALKELGINGVFGVTDLLGGLLAQQEDRSPAAVLAAVKSLSAELSVLKKDAADHTYDENALNTGMLQGFLKVLRDADPQAASAFFDGLPDAAKSPWMFPEEAYARFKNGGVEGAIALAEKQVNEEFAKRAAGGAWWGLAQQDRQGAFAWIESLPPGAFRNGVLNAVLWDAWNQSMSWGSDRSAIDAGAQLLSKASQMDYFASLLSDRRFWGRGSAPSEMIAQLPISEDEKRELYQRMAPVKPK